MKMDKEFIELAKKAIDKHDDVFEKLAKSEELDKLREENTQLKKNMEDFEVLAHEWKRGYEDLKKTHFREMRNYSDVVKELEKELHEIKIELEKWGF